MAHFIGATKNPASAVTALTITFEDQHFCFITLPFACKADNLFQRLITSVADWDVSRNFFGHVTSPGQILNANLSINYYSDEVGKFNICP